MQTSTSDPVDGTPVRRAAPLSAAMTGTRVIDRLVDVALAQPDATALGDATGTVTYGELLRAAAEVTAALSAAATGRDPVGVLRGPGVGTMVAVLGVIGSGAPVLVLDPTTPAARLRHYVQAAGTSVCVSEPAFAADAAQVCTTVVATGSVEQPVRTLQEAAALLRGAPSTPADPVAVAYTSGSTGKPKGLSYDSEMLMGDAWATAVGTGAYDVDDVVANLLPAAFSAGLTNALCGLQVGATQQLFDPRSRPITELPGWLRDVGATVLLASPAILRGLASTMPPGERLDGLRVVIFAGETVHGTELAAIRRVVGERCELRNRYGSSETGLLAEFVLRPDDTAPPGATPVGWPMPGKRFQVRAEDGTLHDHGKGPLVVSSAWLSSGYWQEPELDAAVFGHGEDGLRTYLTSDVADIDDDGCVRLLGRTDHSVKIRGNLVEPGEVEAVLFARPEIREAVVTGVPSPRTGHMRLVAHVVPDVPRLDASTVRRAVRDVLPGFMVPQEVVFLPALPRTERGKLDRAALPPVPERATGGSPARTDWERVVAGLFARVLELDEVGMDDDFFALGGDSLAAEALLAAVGGELGVDQDVLSTALLTQAPTVGAFAEAVRRRRRPEHPTLVPLQPAGTRTPLICVAGAGGVALGFRALAQRLGPDQPVLALQAHGLENRGLPDWSVAAAARRHLRTLRTVLPHGPYRLAGHSLGAVVALEMAHQLRAVGEEVELLAVLDSFPPDPTLSPRFFAGGPYRRLKQLVSLVTTGLLPDRGLGHYLRFHRQGMALARRHRSAPWPGRTLVVIARDDEHAEVRARWAPHLTGPWTASDVPGDHVGMLHEPNVAAVAEALRRELEALDGRAAEPEPARTPDPADT